LDTAPARNDAKCWFRLSENRRLASGKAHVARQHELAAGSAYAALDLGDREKAACAEMSKHKRDRRFTGELRRFLPVLFDLGDVNVGNEIIRIRAPEHEYFEIIVGLGLLNKRDQVAHQHGPQKIHGWGSNVREQNGSFLAHFERLKNRIACGRGFGLSNRVHGVLRSKRELHRRKRDGAHDTLAAGQPLRLGLMHVLAGRYVLTTTPARRGDVRVPQRLWYGWKM
jgi:hypothetical protein